LTKVFAILVKDSSMSPGREQQLTYACSYKPAPLVGSIESHACAQSHAGVRHQEPLAVVFDAFDDLRPDRSAIYLTMATAWSKAPAPIRILRQSSLVRHLVQMRNLMSQKDDGRSPAGIATLKAGQVKAFYRWCCSNNTVAWYT
jgi:hypothetical protein